MIKVTKLEPLDNFGLRLQFSDGTSGVLDCRAIVAEDGPMVEPLRDPEFFARAFITFGAPTWPNGYDMAPWTVRAELEATGALEPASANAAE